MARISLADRDVQDVFLTACAFKGSRIYLALPELGQVLALWICSARITYEHGVAREPDLVAHLRDVALYGYLKPWPEHDDVFIPDQVLGCDVVRRYGRNTYEHTDVLEGRDVSVNIRLTRWENYGGQWW